MSFTVSDRFVACSGEVPPYSFMSNSASSEKPFCMPRFLGSAHHSFRARLHYTIILAATYHSMFYDMRTILYYSDDFNLNSLYFYVCESYITLDIYKLSQFVTVL